MYQALRDLLARLQEHEVPEGSLHLILAAFRGPDTNNEADKTRYTAPLRLYLLGKDGYADCGYHPQVEHVDPVIYYGSVPAGDSHYRGHVNGVVNVIRNCSLPSADGTSFEFRDWRD